MGVADGADDGDRQQKLFHSLDAAVVAREKSVRNKTRSILEYVNFNLNHVPMITNLS